MIGFLRAPWPDKARALFSVVLLVVVPPAMALASFSTVRATLLRAARRSRALAAGDPSPRHVVRTVEVVDRRVPGHRTCLARSTTCETLLRLYGYTPTHRIGVDPQDDDGFAAHSWLEHDGDVLIGHTEDMDRYDELPPLDRPEDT
jgi:hypothetical protein